MKAPNQEAFKALLVRAGLLSCLLAAVLALSLNGPGSAVAGPVIQPEDIVKALLPENAGPVVRSMTPAATRGIQIDGELPEELDLPKISLTINFEYDSHRLTHDGMLVLRALGQALSDPRLQQMTFQIAGHTDGKGGDAYNQGLSEKRAQAVVEHLVTFYGADASRLSAVGYGKTRLAVPNDPLSGLNRRVEIINVSPLS